MRSSAGEERDGRWSRRWPLSPASAAATGCGCSPMPTTTPRSRPTGGPERRGREGVRGEGGQALERQGVVGAGEADGEGVGAGLVRLAQRVAGGVLERGGAQLAPPLVVSCPHQVLVQQVHLDPPGFPR